MADKKKSIIEEAIAEFNLIESALNSNTKEILRSVAKEEINSALNESLHEDEYDIEDIDIDKGDDVDAVDGVAELPIGDSPEMGGSEELGLDDTGMDAVEGGESFDAEEGSEDYDMDMTGASDEEVISVYKKLSGEDEIEVVSPSEVIIKDPVSGSEYNVKLGGGSMIDQGEMNVDGEFGSEMDAEPEIGLEPEMGAEEAEFEPEVGPEVEAEPEVAPEMGAEDGAEEIGSEEGEEEVESEDDDELGESIVYEIELAEDEEIAEDIIRTKGHDKELVNTKAPNTGDIEGQKAPQDSDSGDNLTGGFDDDAQNGSGDNHAKHIMEDESEIVEAEVVEEEVVEESEVVEETEEVDEAISTNRVAQNRAGGNLTDIKGPGARQGAQFESLVKKYNALLSEAKALQSENVMFKNTLKDFRKKIFETAIFSTNLTHVTKLFLEHSTTKAEKQNIMERFDDEVKTIEESKKLYKTIGSQLVNKTPIVESVENKFDGTQTSSQSSQLNETTAYVDPSQKRILELMKRTINR